MKVSVIATVKNEGEAMRPLLDSLINQTRAPDEVVICDGGSTDDTLRLLDTYKAWLPLKIVVRPGSNISQGRNSAIAVAQGPIIAATDAGVVLGPTWLDDIVAPIEAGRSQVVSGWFEPDPYTDFEVVMAATVLPALSDVKPHSFLPSSRSVAFCKRAWKSVGGYPEWLDYGEDLIFDMALRKAYGSFPLVATAVAYFRPRGNMRAFFLQYYRYARGDGKANLWLRRHAIRYITYFLGLPLILHMISRGRRLGWFLLLLGAGAYSRRPIQRFWAGTQGWSTTARARGLALIPLIRFVGDVAKMLGYPVGLVWRRRNFPPVSQD